MEHIFHKIILNIYFDHIHIMCLYRIFSVHCTGYMLVVLIDKIIFVNSIIKQKWPIESPLQRLVARMDHDLLLISSCAAFCEIEICLLHQNLIFF
jgi:hypothetical protein